MLRWSWWWCYARFISRVVYTTTKRDTECRVYRVSCVWCRLASSLHVAVCHAPWISWPHDNVPIYLIYLHLVCWWYHVISRMLYVSCRTHVGSSHHSHIASCCITCHIIWYCVISDDQLCSVLTHLFTSPNIIKLGYACKWWGCRWILQHTIQHPSHSYMSMHLFHVMFACSVSYHILS